MFIDLFFNSRNTNFEISIFKYNNVEGRRSIDDIADFDDFNNIRLVHVLCLHVIYPIYSIYCYQVSNKYMKKKFKNLILNEVSIEVIKIKQKRHCLSTMENFGANDHQFKYKYGYVVCICQTLNHRLILK